jgi:hypothetical protein
MVMEVVVAMSVSAVHGAGDQGTVELQFTARNLWFVGRLWIECLAKHWNELRMIAMHGSLYIWPIGNWCV